MFFKAFALGMAGIIAYCLMDRELQDAIPMIMLPSSAMLSLLLLGSGE